MVEFEREDSEWDALGERFRQAAAEGRYYELNDDVKEDGIVSGVAKNLSSAEAAADFSSLQAPVNPSTIVHDKKRQQEEEEEEDTELKPYWQLLRNVMESLRSARDELDRSFDENNKSDKPGGGSV
eukprot:CAMPEP_0194163012 /NCGR_PEP_ID=MMETSP0152-20130528/79809_1 /TAXON_ID=1049557 /ORGANISM="Thalassiothrix antarctica, Strain L6-D1" /LENGTH=125 /DNA_ID=CAMNT_0038872961 /DNA_START=44 /DNA_END=422 /DNA_ORIENTATION=+